MPRPYRPPAEPHGEVVLTLSSRGQQVIPAHLRRQIGKGQRLAVEPGRASEVIGCSGYRGPRISIEAMDPAAFARRP